MKIDAVLGLVLGDEAKAKVTHHLLKSGVYNLVLRTNGANNAGHTIYHNDKKFITHMVPVGVFFGIKSVIGPGCALHVPSFFQEIEDLSKDGIDCSRVKVSYNTHIITDDHVAEDSKDSKIGTTRRGVGPCFRDKYARTGIRAEMVPELKPFLTDFYDEMFGSPDIVGITEGAQAHYLDPIFGDYPYVTSSHCGIGGVIINGIPHTAIRDVFGVAKAYDTYVGAKKFEPENDPILPLLRKIGREFGATTGRPRQCNYLNIDNLIKATKINGVSQVIMNKMDVLREANVWRMLVNNKVVDFENEDSFKNEVNRRLNVPVKFSYSPHEI